MSDADVICKRGSRQRQRYQQIRSTPNGELSQPQSASGRACVRAPACLMAVMMVMAASTPPQRASRLALLLTALSIAEAISHQAG